ncbi:MAG: EscU/YscU/HrcU family type III secretion system export apparatus switch protein, partial [Acidobacteria bacterium]|nr:EscU/YscU/HrcU family type III secretion system export apparatus switch protein [Acidobacteriota bacterium]
ELTGAITLAVGVAIVFYYLQSPTGFRAFLANTLENATTAGPEQMIRDAGMYFLTAVGPIFAAVVAAALAGNVLQGLPMFASEAMTFKWDRLNPIQGLSRLKTKISWIEWAKLIVLVAAITIIVYNTLLQHWEQLVSLPALSIEASNNIIRSVALRIAIYLSMAVGILAVGDFFIQRWRFEQSIKQTKAEVKEDMKALEGNPTIKGKIKSIQREAARRRMMQRVKDADVIVTNPTHYAVALEYKPEEMAAPLVVAKGRDLIAQRIKELGREHDIPTVENVPLARALYRSVEVEQEIPMELYKAVAEVLAYVYRVRNKK